MGHRLEKPNREYQHHAHRLAPHAWLDPDRVQRLQSPGVIVARTRAKKRITVIGGGTGTYTALIGLRELIGYHLAAVVTVADCGGSSGILRDEYGVLPYGDILRALLALSEAGDVWRDLMSFRAGNGSLGPHSIGNILLTALQTLRGDPRIALKQAHKLFRVCGSVHPVSWEATDLIARYENGETVNGEASIDTADGSRGKIRDCYLSRKAKPNPDALRAIAKADTVVIGPGDIHTSIAPVLLVPGVTDALKQAKRRIFVLNLATKLGQTDDFTARDMLAEVRGYLDDAKLDVIIVNSASVPENLRAMYAEAREFLVEDDLTDADGIHILRRNLLAANPAKKSASDPVKRSLLRHDPIALAHAIQEATQLPLI